VFIIQLFIMIMIDRLVNHPENHLVNHPENHLVNHLEEVVNK